MTPVALRVLLVLGYLLGITDAQAVDGEAAGRVAFVVVGLIMAVFLFYVALSGPTRAILSRRWRWKGWFAELRDLIDRGPRLHFK